MSEPISALAGGTRLNATAIRLYLLLRGGRSLDEPAEMLQKIPLWLGRCVPQVIRLGYLAIVDERTAKGRTRRYGFPTPAQTGAPLGRELSLDVKADLDPLIASIQALGEEELASRDAFKR